MALADRLAEQKNPAREVKCSVCRILAELPPDDATALREALADPTFTHTAIMRALEAEGHHLKDPQPISRHRRLGHA